ncbi:hypothetical protein K502DRAFT_351216 [Neoconidiobolus thromboides FSU 785]|nr:hypothetical protein K502DRAFT_351216 [Neoconidiobolus thromboides FSU 785]
MKKLPDPPEIKINKLGITRNFSNYYIFDKDVDVLVMQDFNSEASDIEFKKEVIINDGDTVWYEPSDVGTYTIDETKIKNSPKPIAGSMNSANVRFDQLNEIISMLQDHPLAPKSFPVQLPLDIALKQAYEDCLKDIKSNEVKKTSPYSHFPDKNEKPILLKILTRQSRHHLYHINTSTEDLSINCTRVAKEKKFTWA